MKPGRKPKPLGQGGDTRKIGVNKLTAKMELEPKASHGLPDCPRHLRGIAREQWKVWAEDLADMNLDRHPDGPMLEGACVAYESAVKAYEMLQRDGEIVEESTINDAGEVVVLKRKTHPAVALRNAAWTLVKAFCSEFGLSPVSRTRLAIEKRDDGRAELLASLREDCPAPQRPAVN